MVSSKQQGPPSGRDFEVYRRVKIERATTRQAASEVHVSQTRVCQIVQRVADFMADVAPAIKEDERREQRLSVAEQVASEQLGFIYGEAIDAWRASKGEVTTEREVSSPLQTGTKVRLTRISHGDCRYLSAASRAAVQGAKLPISLLGCGESEEAEHPPVVDCSTDGVEQAIGDDLPLNADAATACETGSCDASVAAESILPLAPSATVQRAHFESQLWNSSGEATSSEPGKLELPAPKHRPETRQERKRRERMAHLKLKEARKKAVV